MSRRILLATVLFGGTVTLVGCQSIVDASHTHVGCDAWYNTVWQNKIRFVISHNDSRSCPTNVQFGQQTESGAIIYDLNSPWQSGTFGNASRLTVDVREDGINPPSNNFNNCYPPSLGSPVTDFFAWGQARPNQGVPYEWQAEGFVSFHASYNPDYTCFDVDLVDDFNDAYARISINYYGEQFKARTEPQPPTP